MKKWYEKHIKVLNIFLFASTLLVLFTFLLIPFLLGYKFTIIGNYSIDFERLDTIIAILGLIVTAVVAFIPFQILQKQTEQNMTYQKHSEGLELYKLRLTLLQSIKEIDSTSTDYNSYEELKLEINLLYDETICNDLIVCNNHFRKKLNLASQLETWRAALEDYPDPELYLEFMKHEFRADNDDNYTEFYNFTNYIESNYPIDFAYSEEDGVKIFINFETIQKNHSAEYTNYMEAKNKLEASMNEFIKETISLK